MSIPDLVIITYTKIGIFVLLKIKKQGEAPSGVWGF